MTLDTKDVAAVLRDEGIPVVCGPHGFDLPCVDRPKARIERGSGIAGRGNFWHITQRGGTATPSVTTKAGLRRLLREWRTGEQRPENRQGYVWYARLNRNRYGEHYVWVARPAQGERQ